MNQQLRDRFDLEYNLKNLLERLGAEWVMITSKNWLEYAKQIEQIMDTDDIELAGPNFKERIFNKLIIILNDVEVRLGFSTCQLISIILDENGVWDAEFFGPDQPTGREVIYFRPAILDMDNWINKYAQIDDFYSRLLKGIKL